MKGFSRSGREFIAGGGCTMRALKRFCGREWSWHIHLTLGSPEMAIGMGPSLSCFSWFPRRPRPSMLARKVSRGPLGPSTTTSVIVSPSILVPPMHIRRVTGHLESCQISETPTLSSSTTKRRSRDVSVVSYTVDSGQLYGKLHCP